MNNWSAVTVNETFILTVTPLNASLLKNNEYSIMVKFSNEDLKNGTVYFSAPESYLGKKLTSYGGFLKYTIYYTNEDTGKNFFLNISCKDLAIKYFVMKMWPRNLNLINISRNMLTNYVKCKIQSNISPNKRKTHLIWHLS